MWYSVSAVHVDVVLTDVQMCLVQFRSHDHNEDDNVHTRVPIKMKMAARVKISVLASLYSQILLEYDASVSKERFTIIVDLYINTSGDKASR